MGSGRSIHAVAADAHAFCWDNALPPAIECESGEDVEFSVRDASGGQLDEHSTAADVAALDFSRVNPVSGPVFVKDARPGDVLQVDLLEFRPRGFGWTAIIPGFGLLADEFAEPWLRISIVDGGDRVRFGDHVMLPFRPFPGTIGVAPPEPGQHSIVPPRRWGGNIDTRHIEAGTTLYLPVGVEGALLSVGDTHACQGDGEVCGTAIESPMDVLLRLSVRRDFAIDAPQFTLPARKDRPGETAPGYHVCTGVGPDLFQAARDAVRAAIAHLRERRGLDREEAYAVVSVAGDLRIHEIVDVPNWVVGCFVPDAIFEGG
jgi:acetamidase/formamidase